MEHLENLEIPFLSHWQSLKPLIFGIHTGWLEITKPQLTQHNNCSCLSIHTSESSATLNNYVPHHPKKTKHFCSLTLIFLHKILILLFFLLYL